VGVAKKTGEPERVRKHCDRSGVLLSYIYVFGWNQPCVTGRMVGDRPSALRKHLASQSRDLTSRIRKSILPCQSRTLIWSFLTVMLK
jgi:hypothetical protein